MINTMNINKKIVFILPNFRAAGVERVVITLANEMCRLGYSVSLLIFKNNGDLANDICKEIEVIELHINRSSFAIFKLINFFRKNQVCFISSYSYLSILSIIANIITFKKSQIFVCEHTTLTQMNKAKSNYKNKIVNFLMRMFYPLADGIIAVSSGVADDLSKAIDIPRKKIKVLYNPLDINFISKMSQNSPSHRWLLNKKQPLILGIGRLDIAKNFTLLINAFSKITDQTDANLLILGEGDLRLELEQEIKKLQLSERCELMGYISNPYCYLKNADIFVLSSNVEGFSLVIVESLACNTPVISTDCPSGPNEILEDGKWGTLVPMNDVEILSVAMLEALRSPNTKNLQERAKEFDVKIVTQRYIDYLFNRK